MGQEIERKYLLDHPKWQQFDKPKGERYRQGYILTDPEKTIRIRVTETHGYLTIKGLNKGATRPEYEYEIPIAEAEELLDKFAISELSKIRYKIPFKGKLWEVDQFLGDNEGLIVAEIELQSEDEQYDLPEWIGKEVTGEEKYYNSTLTLHPFKDWKERA
jgi:CYTH domain-containing protein